MYSNDDHGFNLTCVTASSNLVIYSGKTLFESFITETVLKLPTNGQSRPSKGFLYLKILYLMFCLSLPCGHGSKHSNVFQEQMSVKGFQGRRSAL